MTSKGVGMAVPDWPNSYGYNMFFFPPSRWVGGIFYEHTHRLIASTVGLMTSILALWLYGRKARGFLRWSGVIFLLVGVLTIAAASSRWTDGVVALAMGAGALAASFFWPSCEPSPKWLRHLGIAAFVAVVLQGVLGGLRVVLYKDQIGVFHALLAQIFLALTCSLALLTSRWWQRVQAARKAEHLSFDPRLRFVFMAATLLIFVQLGLGAAMRHQHAGLAIADFPTAYGKWWPATDPASVAVYNQQRLEVFAANPITSGGIILQMVHRLVAVIILASVGVCAWRGRRSPLPAVRKLTAAWLGVILLQVLLGAATVWSNKAADIATAHVFVGAVSLVIGVLSSLIVSARPLSVSESSFRNVQIPLGEPGPAAAGV